MRVLVLVLVTLILGSLPASGQDITEIPFRSVPDFFQIPAGVNFGEVAGVAVNSRGHIFVFSRSNPYGGPAFASMAAQLFEFDPAGEFVREHGKGLYGWAFAHGVRIDRSDNIWTVDKGSDMIIRMDPEGRVVWVFGRKEEATHAAAYDHTHPTPPLPPQDGRFRQPTDVAWDLQGNTYITDGYINSRVAKYDMNGDWVKSWGEPGTGPGEFRTPHSIAIDRADNVYVGDRGNRRIQVFDTDGNFIRMFTLDVPVSPGSKAVNGSIPEDLATVRNIGAPNSLCIPEGSDVMYVGETTFPGRIIKATLEGEVLGVIGRSGRGLGQFSGAHGLACPTDNELYVAETSNWRVQKLILDPEGRVSEEGGSAG